MGFPLDSNLRPISLGLTPSTDRWRLCHCWRRQGWREALKTKRWSSTSHNRNLCLALFSCLVEIIFFQGQMRLHVCCFGLGSVVWYTRCSCKTVAKVHDKVYLQGYTYSFGRKGATSMSTSKLSGGFARTRSCWRTGAPSHLHGKWILRQVVRISSQNIKKEVSWFPQAGAHFWCLVLHILEPHVSC